MSDFASERPATWSTLSQVMKERRGKIAVQIFRALIDGRPYELFSRIMDFGDPALAEVRAPYVLEEGDNAYFVFDDPRLVAPLRELARKRKLEIRRLNRVIATKSMQLAVLLQSNATLMQLLRQEAELVKLTGRSFERMLYP